MFTCGPMLLCPGGSTDPYLTCNCTPEFNGRFWNATLPVFDTFPVFPVSDVNSIDLAAANIVTSGTSKVSGLQYFEISLVRMYSNPGFIRDPDDVGSTDVTASYLYMTGGISGCIGIEPGFAQQVQFNNNEVNSYAYSSFPDDTSINDLDSLPLGDVRIGCLMNLDTGDWSFMRMDGSVHASGVSPGMVGIPMIAFVSYSAGGTTDSGVYQVNQLVLLETDFEITGGMPVGATAWGIA